MACGLLGCTVERWQCGVMESGEHCEHGGTLWIRAGVWGHMVAGWHVTRGFLGLSLCVIGMVSYWLAVMPALFSAN